MSQHLSTKDKIADGVDTEEVPRLPSNGFLQVWPQPFAQTGTARNVALEDLAFQPLTLIERLVMDFIRFLVTFVDLNKLSWAVIIETKGGHCNSKTLLLRAALDSGAEHWDLIARDVVERYGFKHEKFIDPMTIAKHTGSANGTLKAIGRCRLRWTGPKSKRFTSTDFYIVETNDFEVNLSDSTILEHRLAIPLFGGTKSLQSPPPKISTQYFEARKEQEKEKVAKDRARQERFQEEWQRQRELKDRK